MSLPKHHFIFLFFLLTTIQFSIAQSNSLFKNEEDRVLKLAEQYQKLVPVTVSASASSRSAGGKNDFYSEGDYWWPNPEDPNGPYIRRDGLTNPDNFTAHREAMIRFSQISGALASAYLVSGKEEYAAALIPHLKAWFIAADTRMNPNLLYGQAIKGVVTGRGIGIIDTIHLMEVAKAVQAIESSKLMVSADLVKIKGWFSEYLDWIYTHPYGIAERDNGNNHSVCWAMQSGSFCRLGRQSGSISLLPQHVQGNLLAGSNGRKRIISFGTCPHQTLWLFTFYAGCHDCDLSGAFNSNR